MGKVKVNRKSTKTRAKSTYKRKNLSTNQKAVIVKKDPDDVEYTYREMAAENCDETYHKPISIDEYLKSVPLRPKVEVQSDVESDESEIRFPINTRIHKCNSCMKTFSSKKNLNRHELIHPSNSRHECKICRKKFHTKSTLKFHQRLKHEKKPLKCTFCDDRFGQKYSLCVHVRSKHFDLLRQQDKNTGTLHKLFLGTKSFECYRCKYSTSTRSILLRHMRNIHSNTGDNCGLEFRCSFCKQYLENSANLQKHMLLHTVDKPYKCNYCQETFHKSYEKAEHQNRKHSKLLKMRQNDTKQFKCTICLVQFRRKDTLKLHEQSKHGHKKRFNCTFCGKGIRENYMLTVHVRREHFDLLRQQDKSTGTLHELFQGIRTYECYRCKYSSYFGNVTKHMKTCSGKKVLPFKCELCDKRLANRYTHYRHMNKFHAATVQANETVVKQENLEE